ncbi:MAG: hypothetical protein NT079_07100 [Candidatus Omnitrophica bacterium]|nr:hypothetical protein [Candidatus Omnitrophota bacterium]
MNRIIKTKNIFLLLVVCVFCFLTSSCVYFIAGGVGALGGYAISPDTVEGDTEVDYNAAWDSATEVVGIMGTIGTKDYKLGKIDAVISGAKVTVDLSQISSTEVRLRVKARKNMLPDIKLAQDIFVKIKKKIKE